MAYICYVHRSDQSTPYMEALHAQTPEEIEAFALELLRTHAKGEKVEVFRGDEMVARVCRGVELQG